MLIPIQIEEPAFSFIPLLIVLLLAFTVPIIFSRYKGIPVVVGEILAGMVIGKAGFNWVQEDMLLTLLSNIGLAFLIFLAGIEINFDVILPRRQNQSSGSPSPVLKTSTLIYLLTVLLAGGGTILLQMMGADGDPWLIGFVLSATSLGVLLPILKEKNLTRTLFGQIVFITASLADFLTVILLTVYLIVHTNGISLEIFAIGLLFILFFAFYRFGTWVTRIPGVRKFVEELSHTTVQLKIRGAITLLLIFVALAELVNAELILGAFLAGMIISLIKSSEDTSLVHNLEAFGFGFFIPVFFVMVGVNLDVRAIIETPSSLILIPLLFMVSILVKVVPMIILTRGTLGLRNALAGGFLLNTHLSLEIAIAVIGLQAGLFTPATSAAITVVSALSVLLMPIIFGWLAPNPPQEEPKITLIAGGGFEALSLARELQAHGERVLILDDSNEVIQNADQEGIEAILVNPPDLSNQIQRPDINSALILWNRDDWNLNSSCQAVSAGIWPVIARVNDVANQKIFKESGIQPYLPSIARQRLLSVMVRNPDLYSILTSTKDERDVQEVVIRNPALAGKLVRDADFPGQIIILAISRDNEVIIPKGNVQINLGDRLTLLGSHEDLIANRYFFEHS